jgi:hypothetical protein
MRVDAAGRVSSDIAAIDGDDSFVTDFNVALEEGLLSLAYQNVIRDNVWGSITTRTLTTEGNTAISEQISNDISDSNHSWDDALGLIAQVVDTYLISSHGLGSWTTGSGGSGGESAADIYTYFTDGTRANAFKATGFATPTNVSDAVTTLSSAIDSIEVEVSEPIVTTEIDTISGVLITTQVAEGLKHFFDVTTPSKTMNQVGTSTTTTGGGSVVINIPGFSPVNNTTSNSVYIKEKGKIANILSTVSLVENEIEVIIERPNQTDVLVLDNEEIIIDELDDKKATFVIPDSLTDTLGSYTIGIRHKTTQHYLGGGTLSVVYAPFKDIIV